MDRVSRAALNLGARAAEQGAVVVFEPSGKSDPKLFQEALQLAHVVKYADQRLTEASGAMESRRQTHCWKFKHSGRRACSIGTGLAAPHPNGCIWMLWRRHVCLIPVGQATGVRLGCSPSSPAGGQERMRGAGAEGVRKALRYGQALAAWNCAFEGARGGMYAVDRNAFDRQIIGLLEGQPSLPVAEVTPTFGSAVACPACPPDRPGSGPTLSLGARGAQKRFTAA